MKRLAIVFLLGVVAGGVAAWTLKPAEEPGPRRPDRLAPKPVPGERPPATLISSKEEEFVDPSEKEPPEPLESILARAREHSAEGVAVDEFELLARRGDAASHAALVELFLDPAFADMDYLRAAFDVLMASSDPRLGPVLVTRYRRHREENSDSWHDLGPLTRLVAKQGGTAGADILLELLEGNGREENYGFAALQFSADPRLLSAGIAAIRRGRGQNNTETQDVAGLITTFGDRAVDLLLDVARDTSLQANPRALAAGGLGMMGPARVVDPLLALRPDEIEGRIFLSAVRQLSRRTDLTLSKAQLATLRSGVLTLTRPAYEDTRRTAYYAVEYLKTCHTAEIVAEMESQMASEENDYWKEAIRAALRSARRGMRRASK